MTAAVINARPVPMPDVNTAAAPVIPDGWMTEEIAARRREDARKFCKQNDGGHWIARAGGIEEMAELGLAEIEPIGDRVLTVALLRQDAANAVKQGGIIQPDYDSRDAIIHRVVALGPGVAAFFDRHGYPPEKRLKPGDFVSILATVADRLNTTGKKGRYWTTRIEHVSARVKVTG